MRSQSWVFKGLLVGAIVLGAMFGLLQTRSAQAQEPQTFIVQAGAGGPGNADLLLFAPSSLQVHRGDTVTWVIGGFHNVHFENALTPLIVAPEVNGQPLPQLNPAVAFPSIESGGTFTGGDVNSGLPGEVPMFSLVIDAEPGTYSYLCDVHPGMAASLTVVADDVAIPSATEVTLQAAGEIGATIGAAMEEFVSLTESTPMTGENGSITVQMGNVGAANLNAFFPAAAVINAGESVTWTMPEGSYEVHTATFPSLAGQEFTPIEQEGAPPILAMGPAFIPLGPSGSSVGSDGTFNSGGLTAGQSYSLTFTEPGVYPYVCSLHVGMQGVVVVR